MTVDFKLFRNLHPEGKGLILEWFQKGWDNRECPDEESFEFFIYTYIAFNGWASCVTGETEDSSMIAALPSSDDAKSVFKDLMDNDSIFKDHANKFYTLWPIFDCKDLKMKGIRRPRSERRNEIIEYYHSRGPIKQKPGGRYFKLNLVNTIETIYKVRNNLFHGDKRVTSEADRQVVDAAFKVLVHLLSGLLSFNPEP